MRSTSKSRTTIDLLPNPHPGEILKEEFLIPFELSANRLAKAIGVPTNRITEIVNGTRGITGKTAVLLSHAFDTTPEFWLNLQKVFELRLAEQQAGEEIKRTIARRQPSSQERTVA